MRLIDADALKEKFKGVRWICSVDGSAAVHLLNISNTIDPVKHGKWIPVSEKLPRNNQNVLTFTPNMAMPIVVDWYNGYYGEDDEEWHDGWNTGRDITHWMPLPNPPRMDGEV